ncbi:MAG: acetate--CoA ligase family protein [Bacillota bacterium]|nr:acetate--CoA ligase family protein [Bacillota bacterium]
MKSRLPHEPELLNENELEAFFYPRSLAVIGASQNALKPNGIPLYLLNMFGYRGDLYPVNPKYDRVGGLKCYNSILDIENPVDLAIIGVNESQAMDVLVECAEKKVKAAIVFTSGFAEVGERGLLKQKEMKKLADKSGMRILGPNCLGILNYYNGCMASFFYNQERKDLVHPELLSFITQSGGLGGIIYQMVIQLSIGFNYFVSTGNEADVSFAEILNYFSARDEVSIVAGYMEGLQGDGKLFIEACKKALQNKKLVTMLKVGRTESGAAAAASHTGALVGSDQVYDAVFKQFGVSRADDVEQMNALITLFAAGRLPKGKKMAIITISGGSGVVVADKCPEYGIEVVRLTEGTQEKLRGILPPFGAVGNPVDLTSQLFFDTELFQQSLRLVMQDPDVDIGGFFYNLEMPDPDADKKIIDVYNDIKKPLVIFTWPTGQDYAMEAKQKIIQAGIPVIEHIPSGLWAISALADWVGKSAEKRVYPSFQPGAEEEKALQVIRNHTAPNKKMLTENVSKQILQAYKIPVTREIAVQTADEAVRAAEKIGYPLVMKILSPHIPHKSDAGGVVLNIKDAAGVRNTYEQIMANAFQYKADAHVEGVLVQEMLESGLEVIVGIKKDPIFGPAIVLGLGGIFVEVLQDASIRIAPLREEDAWEMIDELKGRALFDGIRGQRPRDKDALVSVLLQVSRLAVELEDVIEEMDINPLVVYEEGKGVIAADALIVNAG